MMQLEIRNWLRRSKTRDNGQDDLIKLCRENWFRIFQETWV